MVKKVKRVSRHVVFEEGEKDVDRIVPVPGTVINKKGIPAPGVVFGRQVTRVKTFTKRILEDEE